MREEVCEEDRDEVYYRDAPVSKKRYMPVLSRRERLMEYLSELSAALTAPELSLSADKTEPEWNSSPSILPEIRSSSDEEATGAEGGGRGERD